MNEPKPASKSFLGNWMAQYKAAKAKLVEKYGEDFDKPSETFGLTVAEAKCIDDWYESLKPEILAIQKQNNQVGSLGDTINHSEPYYGAVGGGLSYTFIPTSLGNIVTVTESITGKKLNVSDATDWYFYG